MNEAFEKWADSKEANRVDESHQNLIPVRELTRRAFAAGAVFMRAEMLAIAQTDEREILASEGEGRAWAGVHNLVLRLACTTDDPTFPAAAKKTGAD